MDQVTLNKQDIIASINSIASLKLESASIRQIEQLLLPMFKGLRIAVPSYEAGITIYRSRIVLSKPSRIEELSYPPKNLVKEYGRLNDIGQPIFYGSISRNIPFFELNTSLGDKAVMSIWKTKSQLIVNHIGFTDEVFKALNSKRSVNSLANFISDTKNFTDLNTFVYNYLASVFTTKITPSENHLYKLSIAIANKLLMGDLLQGVIYPTVAMSANSDNIALKPSFVDANLELIGVEFIEITKVEGQNYSYQILDSATEIVDGDIIWSGKYLGWEIGSDKKISFLSDGSYWHAKDEQLRNVNPVPTTPISPFLSELHMKYKNDYPETAKLSEDLKVQNIGEIITINSTLNLNLDKKIRFVSFYLPSCKNPVELIQVLLNNINYFLDFDKDHEIEFKEEKSGKVLATNKDLIFNNQVCIYSESGINIALLEKYEDLEIKVITI